MATYSFLTTENSRVDAKGSNPKIAFKQAIKNLEKNKEDAGHKWDHLIGNILTDPPVYIKYNKNGIASNEAWVTLK